MQRGFALGGRGLRRALVVVFWVVWMTCAAWCTQSALGVYGGYFWPANADFRQIYGNGYTIGTDLTVPVLGGLGVWAGAEAFSKTGEITFTGEPASLRITPCFLGLRYRIAGKTVSPYLGVAVGYFKFREVSSLGAVSGHDLGIIAQAGFLLTIKKPVSLDFHGRYSSCSANPDLPEAVKASIGGYQAGVGLVLLF